MDYINEPNALMKDDDFDHDEATAYITISKDRKNAIISFFVGGLSQEFFDFVKSVEWATWEKTNYNNSDSSEWCLVANLDGTHTDEDDFEMSRVNYLVIKLIDEGCFLECRYPEDKEHSTDYKKYLFGRE